MAVVTGAVLDDRHPTVAALLDHQAMKHMIRVGVQPAHGQAQQLARLTRLGAHEPPRLAEQRTSRGGIGAQETGRFRIDDRQPFEQRIPPCPTRARCRCETVGIRGWSVDVTVLARLGGRTDSTTSCKALWSVVGAQDATANAALAAAQQEDGKHGAPSFRTALQAAGG